MADLNPMLMAPDQRRRYNAMLMAQQYDRTTPQDTTVVERAGLLPIGTYANGMTGIAFPGFIADPVAGFVREATNPVPYLNRSDDEKRQAVETGFDVAGAAMVGGLASPKPSGIVGSAGGKIGKPRDPNTPPLGAQREGVQSRLGKDAPTSGLDESILESILRDYGLPYTVESSGNFSSFGPSRSKYYHVETPSGRQTVRLSDHDYASPSSGLDFRIGADQNLASGRIAEAFGISPTPNAADAVRIASEQEAAFAARNNAKLEKALAKREEDQARMRRLLGKGDQDIYANGGRPGAAAGAAVNALDNPPAGIRAYHGSPHDFDRFDMSKIGTGEGAQARPDVNEMLRMLGYLPR